MTHALVLDMSAVGNMGSVSLSGMARVALEEGRHMIPWQVGKESIGENGFSWVWCCLGSSVYSGL